MSVQLSSGLPGLPGFNGTEGESESVRSDPLWLEEKTFDGLFPPQDHRDPLDQLHHVKTVRLQITVDGAPCWRSVEGSS